MVNFFVLKICKNSIAWQLRTRNCSQTRLARFGWVCKPRWRTLCACCMIVHAKSFFVHIYFVSGFSPVLILSVLDLQSQNQWCNCFGRCIIAFFIRFEYALYIIVCLFACLFFCILAWHAYFLACPIFSCCFVHSFTHFLCQIAHIYMFACLQVLPGATSSSFADFLPLVKRDVVRTTKSHLIYFHHENRENETSKSEEFFTFKFLRLWCPAATRFFF